jgi:hypothetical protein
MQTKAEFIEKIKEESQTNIWKNELHLMRLDEELGIMRKELAALDLKLEEKGKPAANEENKQGFVLEQNIAHKEKEIAQVEEVKKYNEYLLNDLLPRYEAQISA